MKKSIIIILTCFFLISTFSCKKNETETNIENTSITGKWSLESYEISNFENTGITIDDWENLTSRPILEFKSGGIFTDNMISGNSRTINYVIESNKLTFNTALAFETHNSFTFNISGAILTLKREDKFTNSGLGTYTESTTIILKKI